MFARLARSEFRSRFRLRRAERAYVTEKGLATIRRHAADFVHARLAAAFFVVLIHSSGTEGAGILWNALSRFGVPVSVNNDCNCFALGVCHFGEAHGYRDVVCIALGTGVGAGVVIDGKLYCGHNTGAGEIGCVPYLDRDYEYYCSSRFFVGHGTTGKQAYERAVAGDPEALKLWKEFGRHVGRLVMLILYAYDPEAIVFGGSISHAFDFFSEAMHAELVKFPYARTVERVRIRCSKIENIGLLGASACHE